MEIESAVFAKKKCDFDRLQRFGFRPSGGGGFELRAPLSLEGYEAEVRVSAGGLVSGRVFETAFDDEYLLLRAECSRGFACEVREAYISFLEDIAAECFESLPFVSAQANRLAHRIHAEFGDVPDFPWKDDASAGVFRVSPGGKWYALVMNIDASKLNLSASGKIDVVNVKAEIRGRTEGVFPAYHMNKKRWATVLLDGTLDDETVFDYVRKSRAAVLPGGVAAARRDWIVPANVSWFDVPDYIESNADSVAWGSRSRIFPGDTVFLYLTAPLSCVKYELRVERTEPERGTGGPVKYMRLLRTFADGEFGRAFLKRHGVNSVRSARRIDGRIFRGPGEDGSSRQE